MNFGVMPDGEPVTRHKISGGRLTAWVLSYGAVLQDLRLEGHGSSLVLGFDEFAPYLTDSPYFGATAGRCANRIGNGRFQIDGQAYQADQNFQGQHSLHGGTVGMGKRNWRVVQHTDNTVTLEILSRDGDMGFPGNLTARCTFSCLENGVFDIRLTAETDAPTLCNLAHHTYWNLDGGATTDDHRMQLDASTYTPVDDGFIPTGERRDVAGSRFDFRQMRPIKDKDFIDHNLCLSDEREALRKVGTLVSDASAVSMEITTSEPGIQVYDGFKLNVGHAGLDGATYGANAGVALEPQIWPDAVNHENFPNAVLRPGETYNQHTQFVFSKG